MDLVRSVKPGWTLHEMLMSLGIMGVVAALAAHAAVAQLRFFQGVVEVTATRSQVAEVGAIVAAVVWGVAPAHGEILVAQDSALELAAPAGVAVVCAGGLARLTVAAPESRGNSLASWDGGPEAGDAARLLVSDSSGSTWLNVTIASPPAPGAFCPVFAQVRDTREVQLREPIVVPAGSVLRWTRRIRLSLYRASDSRWYLGAREWNVAAQRFNSIQPVAGPVLPYSADASRAGLRFRYDALDGTPLEAPIEAARIASITVITRAAADSSSVTIGLRNAR